MLTRLERGLDYGRNALPKITQHKARLKILTWTIGKYWPGHRQKPPTSPLSICISKPSLGSHFPPYPLNHNCNHITEQRESIRQTTLPLYKTDGLPALVTCKHRTNPVIIGSGAHAAFLGLNVDFSDRCGPFLPPRSSSISWHGEPTKDDTIDPMYGTIRWIESGYRTIELSPSGVPFCRSSGDSRFGPLEWTFLCVVGGGPDTGWQMMQNVILFLRVE